MGRPTHLRRVSNPSTRFSPIPVPSGFRARVETIRDDGRLGVRRTSDESAFDVRLSWIAGYAPSVGDELFISSDGVEGIATAVLSAARGPALVLGDGSRAEIARGAIELRDPDGRLLLRYRAGSLEIAPATGDLRLAAPSGAVRIEAATDVTISAHRDARLEGERSAELSTGEAGSEETGPRVRIDAGGARVRGKKVEIHARHASTVAAIAEVVATEVRTSAKTITSHARKIETTAERIAVHAKELAQEIAGALDTRAGRVRSIVRGAFSLRTRTVNMKSEQDTSIDGRRVLLG